MKRFFDIFASSLGLILLSPIILFLILLIAVNIGRPVFFVQERPGKNGNIFKMVKFRTMTDARDPEGVLLPDAQRMTKFGTFLRSSSLDELPELWNVLKGHMSIVGPRPLLTRYLPLYTARQNRRHELRPGITGLAQVSGRNALSWNQKFDLDVWYVDNQSFLLDLKIIFLTFRKVLDRDGISQEGEATAQEFRGELD